MKPTTIILRNVMEFSRRSGIDTYGDYWMEFEMIDSFEYPKAKCYICSRKLLNGWVCVEDDAIICDAHVVVTSLDSIIER